MKTKVTIVIATRNRAAELKQTLEELHLLYPDYPVIVVDNASTDDTCTMVEKEQEDNPGLSLIALTANLGAVARNYGVRAAKTPYVAFNDDDSCWTKGALGTAEFILDAFPVLGGIAAHVLVGDENKEDPLNSLMASSPITYEVALPGPVVLGFLACGFIVRVKAFLEAGGFHRLLHFRGEEKLLAIDLASAGWVICYLHNIIAHHYPSARRGGRLHNEVRKQRNELLVVWLRRPAKTGLQHTVRLLKSAIYHKESRRVMLELIYRLPALIYYRHKIPETVEQHLRILEKESGE